MTIQKNPAKSITDHFLSIRLLSRELLNLYLNYKTFSLWGSIRDFVSNFAKIGLTEFHFSKGKI